MRRRVRAAIICVAALCGVAESRAAANPRTIEIDLRDSIYFFAVPAGYLGPFDSQKLDLISAGAADVLFLHAVTTNRIDPSGDAHGKFARIEDDQRLGASTLRVAAGVGGGVLGQRSATVAFAQPVSRDRRVALSAAVDLTALNPHTYQRVVGAGPELAIGSVDVVARYYRATTTSGVPAPSSASVLAAVPISGRLGLSLALNFGGELNADRTSGFLPTSSGRFGSDLSAAVRAGLGRRVDLLAAYDAAVYRGPPDGEPARIQHVVTFGLALRPGRR